MSIKEFMNNNDFLQYNVAQYLCADHLKPYYTNEVIKEFKEYITVFSIHASGRIFNLTDYIKYRHFYNITSILYSNNSTYVYLRLYITHKPKYNVIYKRYKKAKLEFDNYILLNYEYIPPSIIIQMNYFD
jgi:hypothetical protein